MAEPSRLQNTAKDLLFQLVSEGRLAQLQSLINNKRFNREEREELINAVDDNGEWMTLYLSSIGNERVVRWEKTQFRDGDGEDVTQEGIIDAERISQEALDDSNYVEGLYEFTALHMAAHFGHEDVVRWLLSDAGGRAAGFRSVLLSVNSAGFTALHIAAREGRVSCLQALLEGCKIDNGEREALLNAISNDDSTVLHAAAYEGQESVIRWLLSDSGGRALGFKSLLAKNQQSCTALLVAAERGHIPCLIALVEGSKIENGEREELLSSSSEALWFAAANGRESVIRWLLSDSGGRGAGFVLLPEHLSNALYAAAECGRLSSMIALLEGCKAEERVELINAVDDDHGATVLHKAASSGQEEIIRWLLSDSGGRAAGFNSVLAKDVNESNALFLTIQDNPETSLTCLQAVVEGCKVENGEREEMLNAIDSEGRTLVHNVFRDIPSLQWLLSDSGGRAAGLKSSTITATTTQGESALHWAAENLSDYLRALLSGCTTGERLTLFLSLEEHGWSVLHCAARYGKPDNIRELLLHHPETKIIVNHRDHRGMTALHRAVLKGGPDEESRKEWRYYDWLCDEDEPIQTIQALLTFTPIDDGATNDPQAARLDVNLGLKIE